MNSDSYGTSQFKLSNLPEAPSPGWIQSEHFEFVVESFEENRRTTLFQPSVGEMAKQNAQARSKTLQAKKKAPVTPTRKRAASQTRASSQSRSSSKSRASAQPSRSRSRSRSRSVSRSRVTTKASTSNGEYSGFVAKKRSPSKGKEPPVKRAKPGPKSKTKVVAVSAVRSSPRIHLKKIEQEKLREYVDTPDGLLNSEGEDEDVKPPARRSWCSIM